jgi:hypothetical protein
MTRLQEWLKVAGSAAGIPVKAPFSVALPSGASVEAAALIVGIGSPRGMIVVTSFDQIRDHVQELVTTGYGYTTLSEPSQNESLDIESFKEMFRDWGWSG